MQVQRRWSNNGFGLFEENPGGTCGRNRVSRGGKNDEGQEVWVSDRERFGWTIVRPLALTLSGWGGIGGFCTEQ